MTILMVKANLSFPELNVVVTSTILLVYIYLYMEPQDLSLENDDDH
jgi:hypothetical protein